MSKLKILLALTEPESANVLGRMIPVWAKEYDLTVIAQSGFCDNELAYEILKKRFSEGILERYGVINPVVFEGDDARHYLNDIEPDLVITDTIEVTAGRTECVCQNIFCEARELMIPRIVVLPYPYMTEHELYLRIDEADKPEGVIAITSSVGNWIADEFLDHDSVVSVPAPSNLDMVGIANSKKLGDYEIELRRGNGLKDSDNVVVYETSAHYNERYAIDSIYFASLDTGFKIRWIFHPDEKEEIKEYCLSLEGTAKLVTTIDVYDENSQIGNIEIPMIEALTSLCRKDRGIFASVESSFLYKLSLISELIETNVITAFIGENSSEPAAVFSYSIKGKGIADVGQALNNIKSGKRKHNWVAPIAKGQLEKDLVEQFDEAFVKLWKYINTIW